LVGRCGVWQLWCRNTLLVPRRTVKSKIAVVLVQDVPRLGEKGRSVQVAKGYARNFLFPRKLALYATRENVELLKSEIRAPDPAQREQQQFQKIKRRLSKVIVSMKRHLVSKAPPVLHAPISVENIVEKLWRQHQIKLEPQQFQLPQPIKELGLHSVIVAMAGGEIKLKVKVDSR